MLSQLGAGLLDADRAGHEVLRLPQVEASLRTQFGDEPFGLDGHVDRARLAGIVFGNLREKREKKAFLEQLTHPEIERLLSQQADALRAAGTQVAVLDAPLLVEAGWDEMCEKLIFVDAPRGVRLERAMARGWSEEDFAAREGAQMSLDLKRQRADTTIDSSGSLEQAQAQV
ncbi:MAG TPA: dephospho-CoA kinase, partial [Thermoguttaceae bacterium]|nr:dephospho-CoA kinase [Thermoguttaceae bacterium]